MDCQKGRRKNQISVSRLAAGFEMGRIISFELLHRSVSELWKPLQNALGTHVHKFFCVIHSGIPAEILPKSARALVHLHALSLLQACINADDPHLFTKLSEGPIHCKMNPF